MPLQSCNGALCQCSFGSAPAPLTVLPDKNVMSDQGMPAGTIMDFVPFLNVSPFGMCSSPNYPTMIFPGVPGPCIPAPVAPWAPGSPDVTIQNIPALTAQDTTTCALNGVISFAFPGQTVVQVD
jgi:hypothetical protein